jgi:tetratricopeptide (TPR) repeat protein
LSKILPELLLSVCLIVKNEEEMLGACLESVTGLADEIVVYDTGSTDRTIEIARSAGAKVIEGYWDDDFARARNAALEHAIGEWVLTLDADETFICDPQSIRHILSDRRSDLEAFLVAIENLEGAGNARSVHTSTRVVRRTAGTWRHRLHEQIGSTDNSGRDLRTGYLSGARIIHRGYTPEVMASKNKAERNLALAKAALDDDELGRPYALMNYGRSLAMAGRSEEAIEALRETATLSENLFILRLVNLTLANILVRLGRFEEALGQVSDLRRISTSQIAADIVEGRARIGMGENERGLAILARVPLRGRDDDAMEYAAHMLAAIRGETLASLGRFSEAADIVLDAVRTDGVLEADLGELVLWLVKAGRHASEIAQALDIDDLVTVLGRALRLEPSDADAILEGVFQRFPDRLEPLAAAGRIAPRLAVERALVWSSRLRMRGLASACPLVAMSNDVALDPRVRILAGAAAFGSFGERAVVNSVHRARGELEPLAFQESTEQILRLAPGLLEAEHVELAIPSDDAPLAATSSVARGRAMRTRAPLASVCAVTKRGGVNIVGAFQSASVEGEITRAIAIALASHGYAVSSTNYSAGDLAGPVEWSHHDDGDYPFDKTLLVITPEELADYVLDNGASPFEDRYVIGVWRSDFDSPTPTMALTAQLVREIWVPSKFAAQVVARATDRLIVKMPLPVAATRGESRLPLESTGTVFMASVDYATGFHRQNPLGVVESFCKAFRRAQGPHLVIETAHAAQYPLEHEMLMNAVADRSDIAVLERFDGATGRIIREWGAEQSCFVSLHRSEGTGLALARAINAGVVSIVTAHSYGAEMLGERDSYQVPFTLEKIPAIDGYPITGEHWVQPDLERAASAMRSVAEGTKLAKLKARRTRETRQRLISTSQSVRAMRERLSAIDDLRYANAVSDHDRGAKILPATN